MDPDQKQNEKSSDEIIKGNNVKKCQVSCFCSPYCKVRNRKIHSKCVSSISVMFSQKSSLSVFFPHPCKKCFMTDFNKSVQ